jgi:hypothetical protein
MLEHNWTSKKSDENHKGKPKDCGVTEEQGIENQIIRAKEFWQIKGRGALEIGCSALENEIKAFTIYW